MQAPRGPAVKEEPTTGLKHENLAGIWQPFILTLHEYSFQSAFIEGVLVVCRQVFHRWAPPKKHAGPRRRFVNRFTTNMERLTLTRGNPDAFLSTLTEFCEDSLSTCFSRDADELCVPVGFSSLSMLLLLSSCFL